jgi:hypothetical protein
VLRFLENQIRRVVFQPWILKVARSGLPTRIVMMESGSLCGANEELNAFLELESATRSAKQQPSSPAPDEFY